jgi:hypothetical protein
VDQLPDKRILQTQTPDPARFQGKINPYQKNNHDNDQRPHQIL